MILVIGSTKGGCGKSTTSINLAAIAAQEGRRVMLVDLDPLNKSSQGWHSIRSENWTDPWIDCSSINPRTVAKQLVEYGKTWDLVIADIGAGAVTELRQAAGICDMMIVPMQCSQFDILSIDGMISVLREVEGITGQRPPAKVLASQASTHAAVQDRAQLEAFLLSDAEYAEYLPILKSTIYQRSAYKNVVGRGVGVVEYEPRGKAAEEVRALYEEIKEEMTA